MKKIFLIIMIFLFPVNVFAEENEKVINSGAIEIDENNDKSLTDFILKRKDRIEEILKKSDDNSIEKKFNEIEENITSKKNNSEVSNEILKNLKEQFDLLNKKISEKNKEIEDLNAKDSEKVKKEIKFLEKEKIDLEKKINLEKDKNLALEIEISELEIYKRKYEKLLQEQKNLNLKEREKNLAIYFWIFLIYLIISWFWLRIKNSQKKSIFNVVLTIFFIMSLLIFTLVINPGFMIVFIIIAWSMVLTFKDFIVSLMASILILRKYKIWDLVEIEGKKWKINSVSAFNTTLLNENWEIFLLNNFLISKPLQLVKREEENLKIKILIEKNKLKENLKNIKNIFKNDEIKFSFTEKEENKIEIELEITWLKITEKIEKIFL